MMAHFSPSSFVAGVMLGLLIAGAWFIGGTPIPKSDFGSSYRSLTSVPTEPPESGAISVNDQPAGSEVTVESVTVPPPGVWIAVRELNGENLGNVLGAARVGGPRSTISIPLLRATEPDRTYATELYRDDNNGEFAPSLNSVYVDFDTGASVVAYFKTIE